MSSDNEHRYRAPRIEPKECADADYIDEGTEFMRQNAFDDFSRKPEPKKPSTRASEGENHEKQ